MRTFNTPLFLMTLNCKYEEPVISYASRYIETKFLHTMAAKCYNGMQLSRKNIDNSAFSVFLSDNSKIIQTNVSFSNQSYVLLSNNFVRGTHLTNGLIHTHFKSQKANNLECYKLT